MGGAVSTVLDRLLVRAQRAEDSVARFDRLSRMSAAELAAVLGGDPAAAEPWVRAAASHGMPEAQVRLGRMLLAGEGTKRDEQAAYRWFLRAAREGDADAMNMLGRCHENGWGVAAGDAAAAPWFRRAAEAGHDWGEYNYAHMLFDGRGGVPINRAMAYTLYLRAAQRGHARAMNLVGRCLEAGWGITSDPAAAETWYERSAETGYFRGQFNHAVALIERGCDNDAWIWLDRAYRSGDDDIRRHVDKIRRDSTASVKTGRLSKQA